MRSIIGTPATGTSSFGMLAPSREPRPAAGTISRRLGRISGSAPGLVAPARGPVFDLALPALPNDAVPGAARGSCQAPAILRADWCASLARARSERTEPE